MTNPNDLIRRGDAVAALSPMLRDMVSRSHACGIINAIPAAPVPPEVLALVEAAKKLCEQFALENPMRSADYHGDMCQCRRCRFDNLSAALAAWEASRA